LFEVQAHGLADAPPDAVSRHGFAQRPRRGKTNAGSAGLQFPDAKSREKRARESGPPIIDSAEIRGSQETNTFRKTRDGYLSELTVSLWRPRARRRASTARPFLVSMRVRNPCVFARRRLFG